MAGDETLTAPPMPAGADSTLAAAAPADAPLPLGAVDPGRYERCEEIARGGMGRIVRVVDRRLDRELVAKELHRPDPALRARFEREMRIMARLQHPAIVGVIEAGLWPGG